jgi:uncharacterized MAPEG superfamily protein
MSDLEFYTILSAIWIGICWLPYILDRVLTRGLFGALANYNPTAKAQSGWAIRAMRAHQVAIETFVVFAPLSVLTLVKSAEAEMPGTFGLLYFAGIFAHYWLYLLGVPVLRTFAFLASIIGSLGLGLNLLGMI